MNLKLDIDPHDICRICMSQSNSLVNYFSNIVVDGYIIAVPDMVKKYLDIESDRCDGLPDKICDACKLQITTFHLFKEKSTRTEQILLTAFNKPIRRKTSDKPSMSTVAVQTTVENTFPCMHCKLTFVTEHLLGLHISLRHFVTGIDVGIQADVLSELAEEILIEEIPEPFEDNYKKEMKLEILDESSEIEVEELQLDMDDVMCEQRIDDQTGYEVIQSEQIFQCERCLNTFTKIDLWQNHKCPNSLENEVTFIHDSDELSGNYYEELIHEIDVYECIQCHANFTTLENYTAHRNKKSCDKQIFQVEKSNTTFHLSCLLCRKRFKTTSCFNQHIKLHESIEMVIDYLDCFSCEDCHKLFLLEKKLLKHDCPKKKKKPDDEFIDESCTDYQYLDPVSDFTCEVCSMEFSTLYTAKQHIVTHSKQFFCPFEGCGCTYEIWSRFAMHLGLKHLNGKKHQCRFCEQECDTFDLLQAHYKEECPEKKFKCDHCEKSYFSQKALNLHMKDITKGKTFNCTICKKSFNRRGELDLHSRSHTNERPYKCTICSKAYKTSSMRAAHMDAHIEGKTFPCQMCNKKLQTRTSYRNHMKRHTEEKKHQCEHCGKKFFTKFHVKLHSSKIHEKLKLKIHHFEDNIDSLDEEQAVAIY